MIRIALVTILAAWALSPTSAKSDPLIELGIDVLLESNSPYFPLVSGKRVGLVTNPSGVDRRLVPSVDRLAQDGRFSLVKLFSPEHGIRGQIPAGESVADSRDPLTGIPVLSLYGTQKRPSSSALEGVDVILFDIQDVGSRTYTYVSTLGEVMKACAETAKPLVVLDRPNPLGGLRFEGPMIEEAFRSFIGWGPLPVTHGMTVGEIARYFKSRLDIDCDLHVVPMKGWRRDMTWEKTGLTWTVTSPHIPGVTQAMLYTTTGMVAATLHDLSEGVGSTMPFEIVAAPFIDAASFEKALRTRSLPGIQPQAIHFKPFYGRYRDTVLHGVRLHITNPGALQPLRTAVEILTTLKALFPQHFKIKDDREIGIHWGSLRIKDELTSDRSPDDIAAGWQRDTARFAVDRQQALLYD